MTKENFLFSIIGLLLGTIIGFFVANSINTGAAMQAGPAAQAAIPGQPSGAMPAGHPAIPGADGQSVPEVQAAIESARKEPKNFEAQMKAAEVFYQIQRFEGAIEFLKNANSIQPENYEVMVNLGNANFDAGNYAEAEKWYSSGLAKKPDDLNVRTDLGLTFIFREKPDYDRAVAEFKRVLDADPNHAQALQNITVAYTKKADAANAQTMVARLEKADPQNTALAKLKEDIAKLK